MGTSASSFHLSLGPGTFGLEVGDGLGDGPDPKKGPDLESGHTWTLAVGKGPRPLLLIRPRASRHGLP